MQKIDEGFYYEIRHANGDIKGAIGRATDVVESCFGHTWTTILIFDGERTYSRRCRASDVKFVESVHNRKQDSSMKKSLREKRDEWLKDIEENNYHVLKEALL